MVEFKDSSKLFLNAGGCFQRTINSSVKSEWQYSFSVKLEVWKNLGKNQVLGLGLARII